MVSKGLFTMKMRLPAITPIITSYPRHAYPLTFISLMENSQPWIYANFLQLRCKNEALVEKSTRSDWFDFDTYLLLTDTNPLLESQVIFRDFLLKYVNNIVEFTINSINEGYYFFTYLDEYYVPKTRFFQKSNFPHAELIFGYDKEDSTFDIGFYDGDGKYSFGKISFNDYRDSFLKLEISADYMKFNFLLKLKADFNYKYDLGMNIQNFKDYLFSKKTCDNHYDLYRHKGAEINAISYGLEVYSSLDTYIALLEQDEITFDLRPFHVLWEQKRCLKEHIDYLNKLHVLKNYSILDTQIQVIENETLLLRNLFLKVVYFHIIGGKTDLKGLKAIKPRLQQLHVKETAFFENLIEQLT